MIKAGIIGSTGYAGGELARLLLQRDDVEIKCTGRKAMWTRNTLPFIRICLKSSAIPAWMII